MECARVLTGGAEADEELIDQLVICTQQQQRLAEIDRGSSRTEKACRPQDSESRCGVAVLGHAQSSRSMKASMSIAM